MTIQTRNDLANMSAMIEFSAMAFGAAPAEDALQDLAEAMGVSTIAILRRSKDAINDALLAQNKAGCYSSQHRLALKDPDRTLEISLDDNDTCQDRLLLVSHRSTLSPELKQDMAQLSPWLAATWQRRLPNLDRSLLSIVSATPIGLLDADNPHDLTKAEQEICFFVARGYRPKQISEVSGRSLATVRTHLRHIYSKTGLDGHLGLARHLGQGQDRQADRL